MKGICAVLVSIVSLALIIGCGDKEAKKLVQIDNKKQVKNGTNIDQIKKLELEEHDGIFFSIKKPAGWDIITAGSCSLFSFYIRDRKSDLNQIFYFGSVGPVYMTRNQKRIDASYTRSGGYPIAWQEMPVVEPLIPENFLQHWHAIVSTQLARQFMQPLPQLENIEVISSQNTPDLIKRRAQTRLIRAVFEKNGRVGEGLFLITTAPYIPFTGGPGGGNAYGLMIIGITASKRDFKHIEKELTQSIRSFNISRDYINNCILLKRQLYRGIMIAGQNLREASDIIIDGWEKRNKVYDIISEKRSDAILEKERLYNPDTGIVYEFTNGFYDKYKYNKNTYNNTNLIPLPDNDYDLWNRAPLNGYEHVRKENKPE